MRSVTFHPSTLNVKVGTTVTWVWRDGPLIPHNVDGRGDLPDLYSGNPKTSGTYTYTFKTAGTYHITCDVHPAMHLTVTAS
jgi:plastocyanin